MQGGKQSRSDGKATERLPPQTPPHVKSWTVLATFPMILLTVRFHASYQIVSKIAHFLTRISPRLTMLTMLTIQYRHFPTLNGVIYDRPGTISGFDRRGIKLKADGARLQFHPRSAVTPALADLMTAHKAELLAAC